MESQLGHKTALKNRKESQRTNYGSTLTDWKPRVVYSGAAPVCAAKREPRMYPCQALRLYRLCPQGRVGHYRPLYSIVSNSEKTRCDENGEQWVYIPPCPPYIQPKENSLYFPSAELNKTLDVYMCDVFCHDLLCDRLTDSVTKRAGRLRGSGS